MGQTSIRWCKRVLVPFPVLGGFLFTASAVTQVTIQVSSWMEYLICIPFLECFDFFSLGYL